MSRGRRAVVGVVAFLLVLSLIPGTVLGASAVGGSVVVAEGETVSSLTGIAGSVVIHGTVTGDVTLSAGSVLITGTVGGDVSVATGSLRIAGDVGGDVTAGAGSIYFEEGSNVAGNVNIGAGEVRMDGAIGGDVKVGAEQIILGDAASIAGSLTYDGSLEGNLGAVAGDITRDRSLAPVLFGELSPLGSWVVGAYTFLANLILGALLLALFPRFSDSVAERVRSDPITTGVVGFGALLVIPVALLLITVTIIGIPLAIAGLFGFLFAVWIGLIYGRFALGMWLLSPGVLGRLGMEGVGRNGRIGGVGRKWIALLLGLVVAALLALVPILGGILNFLIFLLGLGALARGVWDRVGGTRTTPAEAVVEEPAV